MWLGNFISLSFIFFSFTMIRGELIFFLNLRGIERKRISSFTSVSLALSSVASSFELENPGSWRSCSMYIYVKPSIVLSRTECRKPSCLIIRPSNFSFLFFILFLGVLPSSHHPRTSQKGFKYNNLTGYIVATTDGRKSLEPILFLCFWQWRQCS